jgi:hypothetical protein
LITEIFRSKHASSGYTIHVKGEHTQKRAPEGEDGVWIRTSRDEEKERGIRGGGQVREATHRASLLLPLLLTDCL